MIPMIMMVMNCDLRINLFINFSIDSSFDFAQYLWVCVMLNNIENDEDVFFVDFFALSVFSEILEIRDSEI